MCTSTAQCTQFGPNYQCENDYLLSLTEDTGVSCPVNEGWCLDSTTLMPACSSCSNCGSEPEPDRSPIVNGNFIVNQQLVNLLSSQCTLEIQNVFIDTVLYTLRGMYFEDIPTITINFPSIPTNSLSNRKTLQANLDVNYAFNFDSSSDEIDIQYNEIKSQLTASVQDNNFDLYLHEIAVNHSVTSLEFVTSDSIDISLLTISQTSSSEAPVTSDSTIGVIIGVVIAIIIFLSSYIFYYMHTKKILKMESISKAVKEYATENPINATNTNNNTGFVYGQQNSPQNIEKV
jgi:hypothetical protein